MSASVEAGRVEPQHLAFLWPHVADLIARACERGGGDFHAIARDVMADNALLWVAHKGPEIIAAAVTQLEMRGERKICTLLALGGHGLSRLLPLRTMIERYAADAGCDAMEVCGRPGWARILGDYHVTRSREGRIEMEKDMR